MGKISRAFCIRVLLPRDTGANPRQSKIQNLPRKRPETFPGTAVDPISKFSTGYLRASQTCYCLKLPCVRHTHTQSRSKKLRRISALKSNNCNDLSPSRRCILKRFPSLFGQDRKLVKRVRVADLRPSQTCFCFKHSYGINRKNKIIQPTQNGQESIKNFCVEDQSLQ